MNNKFMAKAAIAGMVASSLLSATPVFAAGTTVDFGTFTNEYTADAVTVSLSGKKVLTDTTKSGRALKEGEFSFSLKNSKGDTVETVKNKADGTIAFKDLSFEAPGTYTYTIVEEKGSVHGVKYDESVKTITVEVTGADGVLTAKATAGTQTKTAENGD